jgi:hypothetical protein
VGKTTKATAPLGIANYDESLPAGLSFKIVVGSLDACIDTIPGTRLLLVLV